MQPLEKKIWIPKQTQTYIADGGHQDGQRVTYGATISNLRYHYQKGEIMLFGQFDLAKTVARRAVLGIPLAPRRLWRIESYGTETIRGWNPRHAADAMITAGLNDQLLINDPARIDAIFAPAQAEIDRLIADLAAQLPKKEELGESQLKVVGE